MLHGVLEAAEGLLLPANVHLAQDPVDFRIEAEDDAKVGGEAGRQVRLAPAVLDPLVAALDDELDGRGRLRKPTKKK